MARQREPAGLSTPCPGSGHARSSCETIFPAREVVRKRAGHSLSSLPEGIPQMIALKITTLVLGTGMLVELFSPPDFGPDFVLAIVSCFS